MKIIWFLFKVVIAIALISLVATILPALGTVSGIGFLTYLIIKSIFSKSNKKQYSKNKKGLFDAVNSGKINEIESIILSGIDINSRDENGYTPLMFAVNNNDQETTRFLLDNGADIKLENDNGKNAIDIAKNANKKQMIKILNFYENY